MGILTHPHEIQAEPQVVLGAVSGPLPLSLCLNSQKRCLARTGHFQD